MKISAICTLFSPNIYHYLLAPRNKIEASGSSVNKTKARDHCLMQIYVWWEREDGFKNNGDIEKQLYSEMAKEYKSICDTEKNIRENKKL
jgi:hypothetical protein